MEGRKYLRQMEMRGWDEKDDDNADEDTEEGGVEASTERDGKGEN